MNKADLKRWCEEILPHRITWKGDDGITRSPLREDKNPSFSVSLEGRCFNDFATGDKGTFSELAGRLGKNPPPWDGPGHRASGAPRKKEDSPVEDKKIEEARRIWESGSPAPADHPYLVEKGIAPHGCRMETGGQYDGWLLVPGRSIETSEVVSVQRVTYRKDEHNKWSKRHHGPKTGTVWACGDAPKGSPVILTEGHATAASVKEIVGEGYQVLCVFGTNNVKPIAEAIRRRSPDIQIIIATDGDDAGEKALKETVKAVPGVLRCTPDRGIDWNDAVVQRGIDEARRDFMDRLNTSKEPEEEEIFFDITKTKRKPKEWLVNSLIGKNKLVMIFGPSGSGKSFYALGLAFSVATGVPFFGREVAQGTVAYILGEGVDDVTRRKEAWEVRHREIPEGTFYHTKMGLTFLDPEDVGRASRAIKKIAQQSGPLNLIVVDTLARNYGGDENSNQDMGLFVKAMDRLRIENPDSTILIVHHSGLGDKNRGRGASALRGALDTELQVEGGDRRVTVTNTKEKEGPTGESWSYRLETVDLGTKDQLGNDETSLVLVPTSEENKPKAESMKRLERFGLETWREAAEKYGQIDENGNFIGVHYNDWREVMKSRYSASNAKAKNTAFSKAKKALCVEHSWLVVCDDMYKLGPAIDQGEYQMKIIAEKLRAKKGWSPQEKPQKMNSQDPKNGSTVGDDPLVLPLPKYYQETPVTPRPDPKKVTDVTTPLGVVTGNTGGDGHGDNSRVFEDGEKTGYPQEEGNSKTYKNEPELPGSRDSHPSCGNDEEDEDLEIVEEIPEGARAHEGESFPLWRP